MDAVTDERRRANEEQVKEVGWNGTLYKLAILLSIFSGRMRSDDDE